MLHEVTMPQLGMTQDAGKIVTWFKAAGDAIAKGDALFEVETDKATMEVEAQADGFLTHVAVSEGVDVPVGQVIARISKSADDDTPVTQKTAPKPAASNSDALPQGSSVAMPQLGMTQDTGLLVTWAKALGAAITKGDILFAVETDKATVEVEADTDGFLAATLAREGEEVPVGQAVAIVSTDKPEAPVARGITDSDATVEPVAAEAASHAQATPLLKKPPTSSASAAADANGRILASPKTRRIALQEGLDISRLVKAGYAQPFHVADLDALRALPAEALAQEQAQIAAQHFVAEIDADGLPDFAAWASETHGLRNPDVILASFAGASMARGSNITIAVKRHGTAERYDVPQGRTLSGATPSDHEPDLILRDLRGTALRTIATGADVVPTLTITSHGVGLSITLECNAAQLNADDAITLLANFAGRMEQPLRHLL